MPGTFSLQLSAHRSLPPVNCVEDHESVCYTKSMKSLPIEQIRRRYKREWLLIVVDHVDPRSQMPITGRLLAHSSHRDEIYDRLVKAKGLTFALYSEKTLPQGYAVAFRA